MRTNGRLAILSVVLGCCVAASCSSGSTGGTSTRTSSTPTTSRPLTMSTGFFGGASSAACETDLHQVETSVEAYLALNSGTEVTEAELVQQGLLHDESVLHDIGPGASVIPSPNSGCLS